MIDQPHRLSAYTSTVEQASQARVLVQWAITRLFSDGSDDDAYRMLTLRVGARAPGVPLIEKAINGYVTRADVPPHTTVSDPGLANLRPLAQAFMALVRPRSAFESAGFLPAPFRTPVVTELDTGVVANWVTESDPIPVSDFALAREVLDVKKLGLICAFTRELAQSSDPAAMQLIDKRLQVVVAESTDRVAFLPSLTGSLTNGVTQTPWAAATIVGDLLGAISGGAPSSPFLVVGTAAARTLFFTAGDAHRDLVLSGAGTVAGIRMFVTPAPSLQKHVVAIDSDAVVVADGGISIDPARAAALQLSGTPVGGAQQLVSLWQANSVALRAIRYLDWVKRSGAVAWSVAP
jgi:hypothetical protein